MISTSTNTHRLGHQPGHARADGAVGRSWQGRLGGFCRDAGAVRSTTRIYLARQANFTGASPVVPAFDGILAAPAMWTKCSARHLGTRST